MEDIVHWQRIVALGGFVLATIFGYVASRANFCVMGAFSDVVNMQNWGRMRMTGLAIAVALLGTSVLSYNGTVDLGASIYLRPSVPWLSLLLGGALFGVGMTLAGGCANRNLIRLGAGSIRSLVVLVFMGISAYMTLKGLFGQWRATFLDPVSFNLEGLGMDRQSLGVILGGLLGFSGKNADLLLSLLLVVILVLLTFSDGRFRANKVQWIASIFIGGLVALGWFWSGTIGFGEHPETMEMVFVGTNSRTIESFSFVGPIAFDLELLLLWTDESLRLTFGGAMALGVILGSFLHAKTSGAFRWEGFAGFGDLRDQLVGAVLMGFGGVTALGCTVGQGITGLSTLALGSFLAVLGIGIGSYLTLKWQLTRD